MIICMVGLVWVMEWTSVLVIILRIPKNDTAHSPPPPPKKKKQTNKQAKDKQNTRKTKRESRQQKITVQSKLFHCINGSEHKLMIHLLDFSRHFPLNLEVRA